MIGTDRNYMTEDQSKPIRDAAIRLTMMPRDTNAHGTVFGGIILSYIDVAGRWIYSWAARDVPF